MQIKSRRMQVGDIVIGWCSIFQLILILIGALFTSSTVNNLIHANLYALVFSILLVCLLEKGIEKTFLGFSFFLCFVIFLMGQKLFAAERNVFLTFVRTELNQKEYFTFLVLLSIAIIFTYYSYFCSMARVKSDKQIGEKFNNQRLLPIIRIIFFATLPFALYMQATIVIVKSGLSYTGGYLINVDFPAFVRAAYYIFTGVAMLYLAIRPPKKEAYFVLISFLIIEGGMQLFQGRRALFATTLLFELWYLMKYYNVKKIKRKYYLIGGLALFIIVCLFFIVEQVRSEKQAAILSVFNIVKKLIISTGASDSVIANTIRYKSEFPDCGALYLFDPIINNPITNIISGKMGIAQGAEYIENFHTFSHHISFIVEPSLYLAGYGMGSSYIAEVYLAFGVAGVGIVSIILGKVISVLENCSLKGNVFVNASYFVLVRSLFALPRSGLFDWFSDMIYLLFVFMIVYPFYRKMKQNCNK